VLVRLDDDRCRVAGLESGTTAVTCHLLYSGLNRLAKIISRGR
jgi:hypothetical protein